MPAISSVPPREPSSQPTTSTVTRRSSKRSSATFRLGRPQAFPETFIAQRMSLESFTAEELVSRLPGAWASEAAAAAVAPRQSAGNEAGAEEAADPDEWARQRRMSSLLSGLGLVFGTTALTTTIVEAEEVEAEEGDLNLGSDISYIVGYPTSPMPDSRTSTSASSPESESEAAFESAEEGDEDASRSASRVGSERVRSREPSEPSIPESKPFSPSSLSTIVDNSPVVTHFPTFPHTVTQATPVLPSAENESVSIEFGYALDGQTLGQGLKEEPGELSDEDAPSSVKQLLRQSWRLSNGSHDFTPAEEKRLSDRAAERLELDDLSNLSLHITDMVSPRSGSLSSYKPSARPPFSRASSSAHSSTPGTPLSPPLQPFPTTPTPEKADGDRSERTRYPSVSSLSPGLLDPVGEGATLEWSAESKDPRRRSISLTGTTSATSSPRHSLHRVPTSSRPPSPARTPSGISTPLEEAPRSELQHQPSVEALPRRRAPSQDSASLRASKSMSRISGIFSISVGSSRSRTSSSSGEFPSPAPSFATSASTPPLVERPPIPVRSSSFRGVKPSPKISSPVVSSPPPQGAPIFTAGIVSSPNPSEPPSPSIGSSPSAGSSPFSNSTWKSTMTPAEYETMSLRYGRLEMRRQEVIWELCETEKSFVAGLCGVIRVFTLPLRTPEGAWIKGVPVAVSRLFDWLQDIVFLHSQISAALQSTRISNFVVSKIADAFLPFVSRLEVHQPYLVRFEAVTKAIDEMTADAASDFGEFVRMQSSLPECAALSLSSFLLKPVQRLMKYPLFFKQLCDLTPATHPDHIATLSLLHSTDSMIRVMQEVKTREDEYEEAKILESRIRGLPEGFKLARRDRRLVAHGPLRRVHINDKDRTILEMDAMARAAASAPHRTTSSSRLSPNLARLSPDHYRDSVVSDSGSSINSMTHSESSAASWASPSTPGSSTFESLEFGTFSLRLDGDKSPKSPSLRGKNSQRLVKTKAKESSVFAFVFSDLVVLTTKSSESSRFIRPQRPSTRRLEQGSTYKVLETVGLSRVLGVSDLSGKTEHDHLIEVDLLPVAVGDGQMSTFSIGKAALATSIYLTVPSRSSGVRSPSLTDTQGKEAFKWIQAFERSYLFALRSLSFPTLLNGRTAPITQNEYLDTPTPFADGGTSPSLHSFETFTEDPSEGDKGQQAEREERAWWAVRLKQVRKELELTVDGKSSIARLEKWKEERVVKVPSLVGFAAGVGGGTTKEKEKEREKLSRKKSLKRGLGLGDIGF